MRIQTVCVGASILGLAMLAGCNGHVGDYGGAGGSSGGTVGGNGGATPPTGNTSMPGTLNLAGSPQYYRLVRLTNSQWARAVQDLMRLAAPSGLEQGFQNPVVGTTDFSNNELLLDVNQESWAAFQAAAETLAAQVTATDAALAQVYTGTDPAGFISTLGRRAYRRPLTAAEQTTYLNLFNLGSSLTGARSVFAKGASLVIRAMLQSPYFLYRTELGPTAAPLSGYEVAAKLSLWLRDTVPSDALLDSAAVPGTLDTAGGVEALATTMLGEPSAKTVMQRFHDELLHFDRYAQISKLNVPSYTPALNTELQDVSHLFFEKIFTQSLGVREILTATTGFVGPATAPLYGTSVPAGGYAERDLGPQRVGYFSQLPFLTLHGFNADPDPIHRGVSMNLDVLCAKLGPPAATIPPIPPIMPGQTNRQRIDTLTSGCGNQCHNQMINPLGFSFEHFDGMGQYRDTENGGLAIDSSGSYAFMSGVKTFSNAADLMRTLADDPQVHLCYAKKLASHALQRDIVALDQPLLQTLATASMTTSGSIKQVILQLVRSDAFRTHVGGIK